MNRRQFLATTGTLAFELDPGGAITWTEQSAAHWVRILGDRIAKVEIKDRGHEQFGDVKLRLAAMAA